jgi:hypothetical protein
MKPDTAPKLQVDVGKTYPSATTTLAVLIHVVRNASTSTGAFARLQRILNDGIQSRVTLLRNTR